MEYVFGRLTMKECPNCHKVVNSKFCPDCGTDLSGVREIDDSSIELTEKVTTICDADSELLDSGCEERDGEEYIDYTLKYRNDFVAWLEKKDVSIKMTHIH